MFTLIKLILDYNTSVCRHTTLIDLISFVAFRDYYRVYHLSIYDKCWYYISLDRWIKVDTELQKELDVLVRPLVIGSLISNVVSKISRR